VDWNKAERKYKVSWVLEDDNKLISWSPNQGDLAREIQRVSRKPEKGNSSKD